MIIEHTRITRIQGDIVSVPATGIHYGELAAVKSRFRTSLAQVIRLRGDEVFLQVFAGARGVATGDQVRFLGHPFRSPLERPSFEGSLMGRENRLTVAPI